MREGDRPGHRCVQVDSRKKLYNGESGVLTEENQLLPASLASSHSQEWFLGDSSASRRGVRSAPC